jgi:hypothetical protein
MPNKSTRHAIVQKHNIAKTSGYTFWYRVWTAKEYLVTTGLINDDFTLVEAVIVLTTAIMELLPLIFDLTDTSSTISTDIVRNFHQLQNVLLNER